MGLDDVLDGRVAFGRRSFHLLAAALGTFAVLGTPTPARADEITDLEARIAKAPTFEDCKLLGNKYLETKQYDQAIQTYTKALAIKGKEHDQHVLHQRGVAYSRSGKFEQAIKDYEHSLRYNSTDPITRKALGFDQYRIAFEKKDAELAKKAIHNFYVSRELAYAQSLGISDYDEAIKYFTDQAQKHFGFETSEKALGMTREERYFSAQRLEVANKPAALYLHRKVLSECSTDDLGKKASGTIPILEKYIKRKGLKEIASR